MGRSVGKMLVVLGFALALLGGLIWAGDSWLPLGRLPGDIRIQKGSFTFYFPIATSILLSLIVRLLLRLVGRR